MPARGKWWPLTRILGAYRRLRSSLRFYLCVETVYLMLGPSCVFLICFVFEVLGWKWGGLGVEIVKRVYYVVFPVFIRFED